AQPRQIVQQFPSGTWHQHEPVNADSARAASRIIFGRYADIRYHFDKADVILSLDADFLLSMPGHVRHAREFTSRRRVKAGQKEMNGLYAVETTLSITGAMADYGGAARSVQIPDIA